MVGQQDLYNIDISKVSTRLASIEAVNVRTMARNPLLGNRQSAAIAKSGATQTQSENTSTLEQGGLWRFNTLQMVSDPADGARWNLTKLAGLKVGTKFVA
ncbi:mitogen-activated protein kinase kinase kinase kinase 4 isoform 4 [Salmonella phage 35]|uniref:Tail protein P n=2 Tax=Chivirus TaxID=1623283 RepID=A0A0N7C9X0_9CAUD|nr:tail protein P [Salmonella phage 37]YP_009829995.1 mitogen-activated protein kinase kinase kinase kinase 4 isoform 4 [Salmonella phage 35]AKJ73923.1 tail protein P [Salmonella phage 37]AKJ74110.1 mitogen-activated protein kinase kinase kinase kinase 4 isoform 4 [Salmonella phage 35]